ncbi:MAG: glucose 1-dehydrogenase [Alphaproteobacteria bacterium]|nr:glucose 1-dehydrogenase [Alphaproteobacteria bacterium]
MSEVAAAVDRAAPAFRLDGRTALVTGAGRGLGRAAAVALAYAGADLVLLSRTKSDLDEVAAEARAVGVRAHVAVCDVKDGAAVRRLCMGLDGLDIVVNNAGGNIPEPFVDVSEEHLDQILSLNVRSVFLVAQAAARRMLEDPIRKEQGGVIINMTSQMGHVGAPNRTVYCMTKHAVEGLTKALAVELAPHNIRVNSIAPTFIETPMTATFFAKPEFRKWVLDRIPLGRLGRLDEIAAAIVFLASPAAALMTGTSLVVDGGWTAQ